MNNVNLIYALAFHKNDSVSSLVTCVRDTAKLLTVGVLGRTHFLSEKISWTRFLICTRLAHIIWLSELIIGKPTVNYGSPKIIKSQN